MVKVADSLPNVSKVETFENGITLWYDDIDDTYYVTRGRHGRRERPVRFGGETKDEMRRNARRYARSL